MQCVMLGYPGLAPTIARLRDGLIRPLRCGRHARRYTAHSSFLSSGLLIPKSRLRWRLLDKFCSVRSAVDRQVSFLIGDSETRFPGTAL